MLRSNLYSKNEGNKGTEGVSMLAIDEPEMDLQKDFCKGKWECLFLIHLA
mgnify:CR=1 FL=1